MFLGVRAIATELGHLHNKLQFDGTKTLRHIAVVVEKS